MEFLRKIKIRKVSIYETYHGGAVTKIGIYNKRKHSYTTVFETDEPQNITTARIFEPQLNKAEVSFYEVLCRNTWLQF